MGTYNNDIIDVVIVGSGPAGLSAAIYTKRAGLKVLVIEKEYMGTGQIAYSDRVDNYLGIPAVSGYELGENFRNHAISLGVEIADGDVTTIKRVDDTGKLTIDNQEADKAALWRVELSDESYRLARTVIYAAGSHHRHLGLDEENQFIGKGVSYCAVCDGAFFKDKNVVVAGGGNSALGDAIYLSDICSNVYIVHRRAEFRGDLVTLERLKERKNVHFITGVNICALKGENKLEEVVLNDGQVIKSDGLFVAIGMEPATSILKGVVSLDKTGYIIAGENCVTSAPGLYAAGDVRTKEVRQLITAAADGANAASNAIKYIRNV